jgi:DNA replication protein DnaC
MALCPKHQVPVSVFSLNGRDRIMCSACHTKSSPEDRRRRQLLDEYYRARELALRYEKSGLTGRFQRATFESFECRSPEHRVALDRCKEYANSFQEESQGLWVLGGVGTGKTHLLSAIVHAIVTKERSRALLITAIGMVEAIRSTWDRGSNSTEKAEIERFGRVPLLALDDLGSTGVSATGLDLLLRIVDRRYTLHLPTAISSNLNALDLKAFLGDPIFDRLKDRALVLPLTWNGTREFAGLASQWPAER